jgi:hypothetical protein
MISSSSHHRNDQPAKQGRGNIIWVAFHFCGKFQQVWPVERFAEHFVCANNPATIAAALEPSPLLIRISL